jgi:alditol oxidase
MGPVLNWAGNYAYRAATLHLPTTVEQVQDLVGSAQRVRVLGSGHSFTDIADSAELISLDALPADVVIDHDSGTVSFAARLRYGELANALKAAGLALHNLASLPHISVAGAVATATHGSGDVNGNLATAVVGLELVTSSGEIVRASRGDPDFAGLVVNLGALGAVTRIALDVEPAYQVRQRVFEGLAWDTLIDRFDEITMSGYSVSVFTHWGDVADQVWIKTRVTAAPEEVRDHLHGAVAATINRHPILGMDPRNCTPQLGVPGAWSERLPHFRMGFTPSAGEEIHSEYLVPRQHAAAAIESVRAAADILRPVLYVSELRTIAADRLWMSPQYEQDTIGIHFTWKREPELVQRAVERIESALAPFEARPHWGKVFLADAATIASLYNRLPDFRRLAERLDSRGVFGNAWLKAHVFGDS